MAKLVKIVLLKRVPNNGMPSTRLFAMGVTTPVWISAAAALVTAGVTRLVGRGWAAGPKGEAATTALQSACAEAGTACANSDTTDIPMNAASPAILMVVSP